jgi:glycosyltransferase involved in cell wall biosynthesis
VRVLIIDDRVPDPVLGFGYPRAHEIILSMRRLGHQVTLMPFSPLPSRDVNSAGFAVIKLDKQRFLTNLESVLDDYDVTWVSRPKNLRIFLESLSPSSRAPFLYDCEAIAACREELRQQVAVEEVPVRTTRLDFELSMISRAQVVTTVNSKDRRFLEAMGIRDCIVVGHAHNSKPALPDPSQRSNLLFIGSFAEPYTPNFDAIASFCTLVFPHVRQALGCRLRIAGFNSSQLLTLRSVADVEGVDILGTQNDLPHLLSTHRVFVAPTRYASGLAWKVTEALSHGLPVVATTLIASQLEDSNAIEADDDPGSMADSIIRLYTDAAAWSSAHKSALAYARHYCTYEQLDQAVAAALLAYQIA